MGRKTNEQKKREKENEYKRKYDKKSMRYFGLKFNKKTDMEVINYLEGIDNISKYIKELVYKDYMEKQEKTYNINPAVFLSDYLKSFFGKDANIEGKTIYHFKHVINDDEIIIITNNLKMLDDKYILVVDDNKAVYINKTQFMSIHDSNFNAYAIKLNRKHFIVNTFDGNFSGMMFLKPDTFDSLKEIAIEQEKANNTWIIGHNN